MMPFDRKIILVRHGETKWTQSGQHTGTTDLPLLDVGKEQARMIAKRLKKMQFDRVLSSPSLRAQETANLCGFENMKEVDPDLMEWNYGKYEGLTTQEIRLLDPNWSIFTKGAPGGESIQDISNRADRVLKRIEPVKGNVLIFSSGHFLRTLASRYLELSASYGQYFVLYTASVSTLGYEKTHPALIHWNDTSHLEKP